MARYNKVLLALDLRSDNEEIIEKAKEIVADNDAELLIVHVHERISPAYATEGMSTWGSNLMSLEADIRRESTEKLSEMTTRLGIKKENSFLCDGRAANEIHTLVDENDIDLIVMGTHGQHGLQLLLGSTANSVLHGAKCDVLAVRVGNSGK